MWVWQLINRRAKKVTFPLTNKNATPPLLLLTHGMYEFFM